MQNVSGKIKLEMEENLKRFEKAKSEEIDKALLESEAKKKKYIE